MTSLWSSALAGARPGPARSLSEDVPNPPNRLGLVRRPARGNARPIRGPIPSAAAFIAGETAHRTLGFLARYHHASISAWIERVVGGFRWETWRVSQLERCCLDFLPNYKGEGSDVVWITCSSLLPRVPILPSQGASQAQAFIPFLSESNQREVRRAQWCAGT